jgi:nucleoside-diphosphate-sugar epimerase
MTTGPLPAHLAAYRDRSILITGGLGFIGSNLAHALLPARPRRILLIDCLVPDCGGNPFNLEGIRDQVAVERVDLGDREAVAPLLSGVDWIFNLAGHVSHIDSMRNPLLDLKLNASDHVAFLEACRQVAPKARIVFTSTRQVYGRPEYLPLDEKHPTRPVDVNGVSKLAAEHFHRVYHQAHGLKSVILRLTNTYGPRQLVRHARQGFIGWFVRQALDGEEIKLYGDGKQLRDLAYVEDVVEGLLRAGACDAAYGQTLNLGGGPATSLREIAELVVQAAGAGKIGFMPWPEEKRAIDIGSAQTSYAQATALFDWQPRTELAVGLEAMIEYYRRHRSAYWGTPSATSDSRPIGAVPPQ